MIYLAIPSAILGAFLGAWAGAERTNLAWRRYGIPTILVINAFIAIQSYWVICLYAMVGVLSCGYGVPTFGENQDSGSALGAFWYAATGRSHFWCDVLTRGSVGFGVAFVLLLIPILKGNWLTYALCGSGIVGNYVLWGAIVPREGNFKVFGKELLWEDIYVYLGVMTFGLIICV